MWSMVAIQMEMMDVVVLMQLCNTVGHGGDLDDDGSTQKCDMVWYGCDSNDDDVCNRPDADM